MCFPCVRVCVQSTHSAEAQRECGAGVRQRLAYTDGDAIDRRCSHTHPHPHFEPEPADGGTSVVSARLSECARAWEWVGGSKRAWTRVEPPAQNPWGVFAGRAVWSSAFRSPRARVCVCVLLYTHVAFVHARMHARPSISTGVGIADTVRCGGRVYVRCLTRARERCFEVAMRRSRKHRAGGRWWESCNTKPNHPRRSSIRPSCATVRRVSALEGRSVIREQRGKATCSRVSHEAPRPARVSREAPRPARRNVCSGSRWHTVHTAFTAASSGVTPSRCV
jgi:hypothetical protein